MGGSVKASQFNDGVGRVVVEVPALGFAWFPREGPPGPPPPASRMRLADDRFVRNEYFEAEIDPATGGLRGYPRPAHAAPTASASRSFSTPARPPHVQQIRTTSTGPALGEIVSEGVLLDAKDEVLASFRQRFRAWIGRPLLEMRIDIKPVQPPKGYPWHAYYGARFAWRDETAVLQRGVLRHGLHHQPHPAGDARLPGAARRARRTPSSSPAACRSTSGTAAGCST